MFLLIDTSEKDNIQLALFDQNIIEHQNYSVPNRELLACVDKMFKGKSFDNLEGIMVVVGAGNFTNTRIACVVANTFAYTKQIPLLAIEKVDVEKVQNLISELLKQKPGHYISATYSAEPNIGKKK